MNFLLILTTLQLTISNSQDISLLSHNKPIQNGINLFLYLAIHRIKISTENMNYYNYSKVIKVKNNEFFQIQDGNRSSLNKIKIMQYNKGGSLFKNYTNQLDRIISVEKPDILCLSESNIFQSDKDMVNFFGDYNHELNLESSDIDLSRNSILINRNIGNKRRLDLENKYTCHIVLEIKKKFISGIL